MATWNYRVIDFGDHIALHEVHYHADGRVKSYTETPATFVADPEDGFISLYKSLSTALRDALHRPVLTRTDLPG